MNTQVVAAGGVVFRTGDTGPEVVMVHRPKYDDWSFPKGKVDPGETPEETAIREVLEETGMRCTLGRRLHSKQFGAKTAHYWVMEIASEEPWAPNVEIDKVRWVPAADAAAELTSAQDRELLAEFLEG